MVEIFDFVRVSAKAEGCERGVVFDVADEFIFVAFPDMTKKFDVLEFEQDDAEIIGSKEITDMLDYVKKHEVECGPFIIQLNNRPELKEYHISESEYIKNLRKELNV